jgi:hypothetical protein
VLKICKHFYELDPHMRDRIRTGPALIAESGQPTGTAESPAGAPGEHRSQEVELEGEGEDSANISAPACLPNSPQSPSTAPRTPSEGGGRAGGSGSLTSRSQRTSNKRRRMQSPEARAEAASQSRDAGTRDMLTFMREKADKELAIAQQRVVMDQQKADDELAIAHQRAETDQKRVDNELAVAQQRMEMDQQKASKELAIAQQRADTDRQKAETEQHMALMAAARERIDMIVRLQKELGYSEEQCQEFFKDNKL